MVCEQKKYRDNINSASLAGLMIGALLFGNLADRYGRKALMISCCIGASIVCFLQEPLSQGSMDSPWHGLNGWVLTIIVCFPWNDSMNLFKATFLSMDSLQLVLSCLHWYMVLLLHNLFMQLKSVLRDIACRSDSVPISCFPLVLACWLLLRLLVVTGETWHLSSGLVHLWRCLSCPLLATHSDGIMQGADWTMQKRNFNDFWSTAIRKSNRELWTKSYLVRNRPKQDQVCSKNKFVTERRFFILVEDSERVDWTSLNQFYMSHDGIPSLYTTICIRYTSQQVFISPKWSWPKILTDYTHF